MAYKKYPSLPEQVWVGYRAEQYSRNPRIEISEVLADLPNGTPQLLCMRPGETTAYLATITMDGSTLVWNINGYDTEKRGVGAIQVLLTESGSDIPILMSQPIPTYIDVSIYAEDAEVPDPWESWLSQILAAASRAESAATRAESADDAVEDAKDQAISAIEAKGAETLESIPQDYTTLSGDVSDVKSAFDTTLSDIGISNDVTFTTVSGKYISNSGNEGASASFSRSKAIQVNKNNVVEFTATGYLNAVAMIATTDVNESVFKAVAISVDSTERTYSYTCVDDGYIIVSYDNREPYSLKIKTSKSNDVLNTRIETVEDTIGEVNSLIDAVDFSVSAENVSATVDQQGKFIRNNGSVGNSANFNIYNQIELSAGQVLFFNAKGYLKAVAVLASVKNDMYTPIYVPDGEVNETFRYTALSDVTVVISSNKTVDVRYTINSSDVSQNTVRIEALEDIDKKYDVFCFKSIGILGDSLASGASNYPHPDGTTAANDAKEYSWGKFIEREHGIAVSLYSQGGTDTRTWQTRSTCIGVFNSDNPLDCYCIGLGVNDEYLYGADYLGSDSDVHVGNESQNADTYYGNYSKIISIIKAKSDYARIFCLTNPKANTELKKAYNQAIRNIVELYENVYLIDLENDVFYTTSDFTNYWYSAHSTAIGYKVMAEHLWKRLNNCIRDNYTQFLDVQWILS